MVCWLLMVLLRQNQITQLPERVNLTISFHNEAPFLVADLPRTFQVADKRSGKTVFGQCP